MVNDGTTIKVEKTTRDDLKALGKKGESYEVIIRRLLDEREKNGV